jgi:3-hydroxyisobutyrate dehydrogenase-like beta-hydroxyacid dehydrogenase
LQGASLDFLAPNLPPIVQRSAGNSSARLHQKDLSLALQGARALGIGLPNTATCQELFTRIRRMNTRKTTA